MKPILWLGLERCSRRWVPHWRCGSASAEASLGWCRACGHPAGIRACFGTGESAWGIESTAFVPEKASLGKVTAAVGFSPLTSPVPVVAV